MTGLKVVAAAALLLGATFTPAVAQISEPAGAAPSTAAP